MINIRIAKSKKCNGEKSLFITFNYNADIVDTIKRVCEERFYDKDKREWEVSYKYFDVLNIHLPMLDRVHVIEEYVPEKKEHIDLPSTFQYKTQPYEYQKVGIDYGLNSDRWLLGDEQGLGKTKQVIDIAVARKQLYGYKHCLIICGVNSLKWNWVNEVHTHSNEEAHILGQRLKKNKLVVCGNKEKLEDTSLMLQDALESYFIITNIESLRDDAIVANLSVLCSQKRISMIAVDEIHKNKNPNSQQSKGLMKLEADCEIAMTGTPLMNTPLDLFIIFKWLGFEKWTFYKFRNHYCMMGGFGGHEIVGYKHLDEMQDRLNAIMVRRRKEDVLDLPEKTYVDEYVEMLPKQKIIYDEVTASIKMNIDQIAIAPNPLAELIRMRQATGYTGILSSEIQESAKLDRMEEVVEDAIANGRKVVIFSNWSQMTDAIIYRLSAYNPLRITGETPDELRIINVDDFQHDDRRRIIVGTIGAMGTGLTLTAGTVEIFVDHPWNRALYDQAVDRCHRIGQNNNITIYNIMCKNTIDERIWNIVNEKGELSDAIVDGKATKNKRELLEYLLA
jgi:SNF2 family DNA or RNA helicase